MTQDAPPSSGGQLDAELIALSRPRPTITMITAAAVVIISALLLWRVNVDRKFVWGASTTVAVTTQAAASAPLESMVKLTSATLDYGASVRVKSSKTERGIRLAPVAGSNLGLWVAVDGHAWAEPNVQETVPPTPQQAAYKGRLREIDATKFSSQLSAFLGQPQPVAFGAAALRTALASGQQELTALNGDTLARPGPAATVEFEVANPRSLRLQSVFVSRHPDVASWRKRLQEVLGVDVGEPVAESNYRATFHVKTLPPGFASLAAVKAALTAAGLQWTVELVPDMVRHRMTVQDVIAGGDVVRVSDTIQLAWRDIDVVALWAPRALPAGARVILVNDTPDNYWFITPLAVTLVILLVLFAWAFVRAWRYERQESRAQDLLRTLGTGSTQNR